MEEKKPIFKKWWFWVIVILLVGGLLGGNSDVNNSTNTNVEISQNESVLTLKNTNASEFYEILCDVTELEKTSPQELGEELVYESANVDYNIEIISNKNTNEIKSVRIMSFTDKDCTNVFMALHRMQYEGFIPKDLTTFIVDNLGKEAETKIGNAKFKLSLGTSNKPMITVEAID